MGCPRCGQEGPADANFCQHCGATLRQRCPACGQVAPPTARFCGECGAALAPNARGTTPEAAPEATAAKGERRHLTVLFCDLVDSTSLSAGLDPEDWREALSAYQAAAAQAVAKFEGHVAQYLGDGILVYFGYPRAHEDDAERAVRAGLAIASAIAELNPRLERQIGLRLSVRVGIHSGPVVVGEIGGGERRETLALGGTTHLAARLQDEAPADGVALSGATLRLVAGMFVTRGLGARELKGFPDPVEIYVAVRPSGVRSRLDIAGEGALPLVGRERELGLLLDCWQQVLEGRGHAALISGDAGIGKSRLVREMRRRLAETPHTWLECSGSPYARDSALLPVIELQAQALGFSSDETAAEKIAKLERSVARAGLPADPYLALFAELHSLPLPSGVAAPDLSPAARKEKLLGGLADVLLQLGRLQPVILLFEDLHWADASSLELLGTILEQLPTEQILAVFTYRLEFAPPWPTRGYVKPLRLDRLNRVELTRLVSGVLGDVSLPSDAIDEIVERTDGVPLFAEELTRAAIAPSAARRAHPGRVEIPASLRDSLMARLDRLGAAKDLAQLCATLGREFSFELLSAVARGDDAQLARGLEQLVQSELLYSRGRPPRATYQFKHALIQEEAYGSLLHRARREHHRRIGEALEQTFADRAKAQPELLAHHFSEAGLAAKAVAYWLQAGRRALEQSANVEAANHLSRGLALVSQLPDGPQRSQLELALQGIRGRALAATEGRGAESVRLAFARARELCHALGDAPETFPVMFGLWLFNMTRSDPKATLELEGELMRIAAKAGDPGMQLEAHLAGAFTHFWQGELATAREHAAETLALFDPSLHADHVFVYGQDPASAVLVIEAWSLWLAGRLDAAALAGERALAAAERSRHAFSQAGVFWQVALLLHELGETDACDELATRGVEVATRQRFATQAATGRLLQGAARVRRGDVGDGLEEIRAAVDVFRASGGVVTVPYQLSVLADALLSAERPAEALSVADEALELARRNLDTYYAAELQRLRGEALGQLGEREEAESACADALLRAREQNAATLALRAASSLARLWSARGDDARARALIEQALAGLEQGHDRRDALAARSVLAGLG